MLPGIWVSEVIDHGFHPFDLRLRSNGIPHRVQLLCPRHGCTDQPADGGPHPHGPGPGGSESRTSIDGRPSSPDAKDGAERSIPAREASCSMGRRTEARQVLIFFLASPFTGPRRHAMMIR